MRASEHELTQRIGQLEHAMRIMGVMLSDETVPTTRRIDIAIGVLRRYGLAPKKATEEAGCHP